MPGCRKPGRGSPAPRRRTRRTRRTKGGGRPGPGWPGRRAAAAAGTGFHGGRGRRGGNGSRFPGRPAADPGGRPVAGRRHRRRPAPCFPRMGCATGSDRREAGCCRLSRRRRAFWIGRFGRSLNPHHERVKQHGCAARCWFGGPGAGRRIDRGPHTHDSSRDRRHPGGDGIGRETPGAECAQSGDRTGPAPSRRGPCAPGASPPGRPATGKSEADASRTGPDACRRRSRGKLRLV